MTETIKNNYVILVDEHDQEIGYKEKLAAHEEGLLHRAFSIFIFNNKNELMLQRRTAHKYHSGGLWTNTCCSHPRPGETTEEAAHRRLQEEMGFDCPLTWVGKFTYHAPFANGLTEHECDHLFIGFYEQAPTLNQEEADSWAWEHIDTLKKNIASHPEQFTYWFRVSFDNVITHLTNLKKVAHEHQI